MKLALSRTRALWFVVTFVAVFSALQFALLRAEGTALERALIHHATVGAAAELIRWIFPDDAVTTAGAAIVSSRLRLNILRGCEGTEAMFLVIAAVVAFPATWKARFVGVVSGCALTYIANLLRILLLYAAVRADRTFFALLHGYIAPTVLIVLVLLFFITWISRQHTAAICVEER